MFVYRLSGQGFSFLCPVLELAPFAVNGLASSFLDEAIVLHSFHENECTLSSQVTGWVGNAHRRVETWVSSNGILLKVEGGRDFYITPRGEHITWADEDRTLTDLDREILVGPVLVLALALRGTWSLHASAAVFQNSATAFLGESGQGKSTLAAFLDGTVWQGLADDILPVTLEETGILAWLHFPQLKLPPHQQPGLNFIESLPLDHVCLLAPAEMDEEPELQHLPPSEAVKALLSHTAGTRLFPPDLLAKHMAFCGRGAERTPVYQLTYPHRKNALPKVKELLESIC